MSLPVPAEMPIGENFVDANTVPMPNTQSSADVRREEAHQIHIALLNTIQQAAYDRKSALRIFLFNLYSANRFQNSNYADLFDGTVFYYMYLRHIGNRSAIQTAVQDTVDTELPKLLQMYPALNQMLTHEQQADINMLREKHFIIGEDIKRWIGGGGMAPPGYGGAPAPAPGGYGGGYMPQQQTMPYQPSPQYGAYPQPAPHPYAGGGYAAPVPAQPYGGYPQQYAAPAPIYGSPYGGGVPRNPHTEVTDRPTTGMRARASSRSHGGPAPQQTYQPEPGPRNDRPSVGRSRARSTQEKPEPQEIPMPERWVQNEPAPAISRSVKEAFAPSEELFDIVENITVSFDKHKPAIIDGQAVVKRVGEHGVLEYGVITKGSEMEGILTGSYEEHETDMQALQQIKRGAGLQPKAVGEMPSNFAGIVNPKVITKDEEMDEEVVNSPVPVILEEQIAGFSIAHGEAFVSSYFTCMGIADIESRIHEYYLRLLTPVSATARDRELLLDLKHTASLSEFVSRLGEVADEMSAGLWYTIHDRAVNAINKRLMSGLGYEGVLIMENLIDDHDEYFKILAGEYPAQMVDRFAVRIHRYIQDTLNLTEYADGMCDKCNNEDACSYNALYELVSITHVPWSSEQFSVTMTDEYNVLNKTTNPELHEALMSILRRTMTPDFSTNRRLLITADRRYIWVYPSDYSDDTVIISNK